jgi:hypothetical protein
MPDHNLKSTSMKKNWRLILGTWMFYVPFVMFFGAPVMIPLIGLSATQATALVGGIFVAAEVIWFASIPLLGMEGFKQMKSQAFSLLKPNTGPISRIRHQAGTWMFTVGILSQVGLGVTVMMAYFFCWGQRSRDSHYGLVIRGAGPALCLSSNRRHGLHGGIRLCFGGGFLGAIESCL